MTRALTASLCVTLLAGAAASQQQDMQFRGRVTTELGAPIAGASVYMNDFAVSVMSNSDGRFMLVVPGSAVAAVFERARTARTRLLDSIRLGQLPAEVLAQRDTFIPVTRLRTRAMGYVPDYHAVRIEPGEQTVNFQLRFDNSRADTARVTAAMLDSIRAARIAAASRAGIERQPVAQLPQADPFGRFLFTPEIVMQHQDAIRLRETQRQALQTAMQETQSQVTRMQWALAQAGEKLSTMLDASKLDERSVLAHVDQIIAIEREIKRAQMSLLIKIKNTLTPEQQTELRRLRGSE